MKLYFVIKMFRVILFAYLCSFVNTELTTSVQQCASGELPLHTYIEGCITPPCILVRGEDAIIHVVFKSPRLIRHMRSEATAMLFVDYDLGEHADTCKHLTNTYCPLLKDEVVRYTLKMNVLPIFPTISALIDFRVVDTDNSSEALWCLRTTVQIVASRVLDGSRNNQTAV